MPNDRLKRTRETYIDKATPAAPRDLQREANIARQLRHTPERGEGSGGYVVDVRYLVDQLATAHAEVERLRAELEQEQQARLTEVEHWVGKYHELEAWRIQTRQRAEKAEDKLQQVRAAQTWQPIRELPGHWRAQARSIADTANNYDIANAMVSCASELEVVIPPAPEVPK